MRWRALVLPVVLLLPPPAAAQTVRDSVLAAVDGMLRAMAANDTATSRRLTLDAARGFDFSVREGAADVSVRRDGQADFIASLATNRETWIERFWSPTVLIHGPLAIVWAPYDFRIDGRFSHCGIDAATLIRTADGWKNATWTWSVQPTGCPPGPGDPQRPGLIEDSSPGPSTEPDAAERDAVVAAVQTFFDGMTAADVATSRSVLLEGGSAWAIRGPADAPAPRLTSHEAYLEQLGRWSDRYVERMWEPVVLVEGRIAVLWTPYDIHRNGEFQHCGVDAFVLVKPADRWIITSVSYTVEPTGCAPSPLGPLRRD